MQKNINFVEFSKFLDVLEELSVQGRVTEVRSYIKEWTVYANNGGLRLYDWLRLCLPSTDRPTRTFSIKERKLCQSLIKIYGWEGTDKEFQIQAWKVPLHENDDTAGCLASRLKMFREEKSAGLEIYTQSINAVNALLDELAKHSPYSDVDHSGRRDQRPNTSQLELLTQLFSKASALETKWLTRIILQDMKLNISLKSFFAKIHFHMYTLYQYRHTLYDACHAVEELLFNNYERDLQEKWKFPIVGVNLAIMSCNKARSTFEVYEMFQNRIVAVETKYDGERMQVHTDGVSIKIFNKSQRNSTWERRLVHDAIKLGLGIDGRYDLTKQVGRVQSCIIEGEVLVRNLTTGVFEEFGGVSLLQNGVNFDDKQLCVVWFDLLYLNGTSLLSRPYCERRLILQDLVECLPGLVFLADKVEFDFSNPSSVYLFRSYYAKLVSEREEGVIVKDVQSLYTPGEVGQWIKLKKDYIDGLGDTVDFAIIGGRYSTVQDTRFTIGEGRLSGMITEFIVGCILPKHLCKSSSIPEYAAIMTVEAGFSEQILLDINAKYGDNVIENNGDYQAIMGKLPYHIKFKSGVGFNSVDVFYYKPLLFELLGGSFVRERGDNFYTLRFPRFKRLRTDISIADAITFDGLQELARKALTPMTEQERKRFEEDLMLIDELRLGKAKGMDTISFPTNNIPPISSDCFPSAYLLFYIDDFLLHHLKSLASFQRGFSSMDSLSSRTFSSISCLLYALELSPTIHSVVIYINPSLNSYMRSYLTSLFQPHINVTLVDLENFLEVIK